MSPGAEPPTVTYQSTVPSPAQPVQRGLEDRFDVARFAPDRCGGEDEVEHLVEPEIAADLVCLLRCDEQRSPGDQDAVAAAAEHGIGGVGVPEELGRDRVLAVVEQREPSEPGDERLSRRAGDFFRRVAQVVDLSGEQRLEQLTPAREFR